MYITLRVHVSKKKLLTQYHHNFNSKYGNPFITFIMVPLSVRTQGLTVLFSGLDCGTEAAKLSQDREAPATNILAQRM